MKRADRLLKLLEILRTRKVITTDQLALQLGISTRTVYRDLQALNKLQLSVAYQPEKGYLQVSIRYRAQHIQLAVLPAAVKGVDGHILQEDTP